MTEWMDAWMDGWMDRHMWVEIIEILSSKAIMLMGNNDGKWLLCLLYDSWKVHLRRADTYVY